VTPRAKAKGKASHGSPKPKKHSRRTSKRTPAPRTPGKRGTRHAVVGTSPLRVDAADKARGAARYIDDLTPAGCLFAAVVTSPHPHARLDGVDASRARQAPGVVAVLTASDLPGPNQVGAVKEDQPLLASDRLRWYGDRIALVAAETREAAEVAATQVHIHATPLPGVFDPVAALAGDAPAIHDGGNLAAHMVVRKGNRRRARAKAEVTIEHTYTTGHQEHAYLETHGILAEPQADGGVLLRGSMQCPFYVQKTVARLLGLPHARVRAVQTTTGGGFGGKEDYPSEPASCAAVLAFATGRRVKLVYRRDQDIRWSSKRHATTIRHTLLAQRDGTLVGLEAEIFVDAGAYLGLSAIVAERANASAGGAYVIPNVHVDTYTVYTNNPFGGAFRGFGAPQVTFALESQMDLLAEELGRDPIDLRLQNALRTGSRTPVNDKLRDRPWVIESIERARDRSRWRRRRREIEAHNATGPWVRKGMGAAALAYGCCLHAGGQHLEGSAAGVQVHPDASVSVAIGGAEIGQGAYTVMAQLAAETLGFALNRIQVHDTDTALVPDSGPTVASRTTIMSGNAVVDACQQIRARLTKVAAEILGVPARRVELTRGQVRVDGRRRSLSIAALVQQCYQRKEHLSASGWYAPPRKQWDRATGTGQAYSVYCYGAMIAEVSVDTVTGLVVLDKMTAVHDVGQAIFRAGVEGQIQGGVVQGLGYATMEELVVQEGEIQNPNFTDYLIPTALDLPEIDIDLIEEPYNRGPYGAKGVGEPSLIPVAPAIANAVAHALGVRLFRLPLTPERVKLAWDADPERRAGWRRRRPGAR
jgi:CO/xanthine dehydrogenase Mo-binding subunit